jgi:hypothetical protein
MRVLSLFAVAAPLASAIQFTVPDGTTQPKGLKVPVAWRHVETDVAKFNLYLVNFTKYPPQWVKVGKNVSTKSGKTTVVIPCTLADSTGWQL